MDKVAVYAGTRNVYPQMYTSLKSLLVNTPMDRVYLMIEDSEFPYPIPDNVIVVDVHEQTFFHEESPNFKSRYSYMTMLRCCLGFIFANEHKMLWLDIDTIIDEDISDLFELDLTGYYYAGVYEPKKSIDVFRYINSGVMLCNLDFLRENMKEAEMIAFLNSVKLNWPDQDIINILCQGRIRLIGSEYNANGWTLPVIRPKIIHYAAVQNYTEEWAYKKYANMELPLETVQEDKE